MSMTARHGLNLWGLMLFMAVGNIEAYVGLQWPLQIILGDADSYIFGLDTTVVEGWSDALTGLYNASASAGLDVCPQCNGTMSATLTAVTSQQRFSYSATSVASAVMVFPKALSEYTTDTYINTLLGGLGLAPIACAPNASAVPGESDSFLCNIVAAPSALQAPGNFSSASGTVNDTGTETVTGTLAGMGSSAVSPLTFTQLGTTGRAHRTLSPVDLVDAGVTVEDGDGLTGVAMSTSFLSDARVTDSPPCSNSNATLLLGSLATQIVGGDAVYCYDLYEGNINVVLVTAWVGVAGHPMPPLAATSCSAALAAGAVTVTLVFPQFYADVSATQPFVYALFSQGSSLLCAYGIAQTAGDADHNNNWAYWALADSFPYVDYMSCDPTETIPPWSVPWENNTTLTYNMSACGLSGGSCAMSGSQVYVNNDPMYLEGSLQLAPMNGSAGQLGPAASTATCLWLPVEPTQAFGSGSQALANSILTTATDLMYHSGKGIGHQQAVSAAIAGIESDIASLTIFNALSAGISGVAAAAGINAFAAPAFIARHRGLLRIFPILVSIVEAGFVNLAILAYMIALAHRGTSTQVASWFDVDRNVGADYLTIDVFVATGLTVSGKASYYHQQWAVLSVCMLVSAAFVAYRWHFKPALLALAAVSSNEPGPGLEVAPSSELLKVGIRPRHVPYSDAMESKFSVESLGMESGASQGLSDADGLPGLQLATRQFKHSYSLPSARCRHEHGAAA